MTQHITPLVTQKRDTEATLSAELERWTWEQGLPFEDAQELIHRELYPWQRAWLSDFIRRWDALFDNAPSDNVYGYFFEQLGVDADDMTLIDLPLNSPCGQDCKKSIDIAALVLKAYDGTAREDLLRAVNTQVETLWRG